MRRNIVITCIVIMSLFINVFIAYSVDKAINSFTVIATLPDKVKESKLIRIIDKEAGVVCYVLMNDTADFFSGLQCIRLGPFFTKELLQQEQTNENNREERNR